MKKIFYISGITLLALSSCVKEDPEMNTAPEDAKNRITFIGETFAPETRIEIGDKDGSTYPVLWTTGDKIGIISPVETTFQNVSASLNSSDAGKNSGIFVLDTETAIDKKMDLIIYYPYSSLTSYGEGALHSVVPMEQKQARPNDSSHTGKYTLAYASSSIDPATAEAGKSPTVNFSLKHAVAYVKFVVSSSEFASYKLNGVSLWCDGEAIAGDLAVNLSNGETKTETPRNYATVLVEEPQALSSAQELWLVTLPVDLTGKDVYASVSMSDGTKNVTIPKKVEVKNLKANAVNTITLSNVSMADNTFDWYQPVETRYLAAGWAYGEANTYVTTTSGEEITVDVKARGYFNGCEEPKYAKIIFSNNCSSDMQFTTYINGKRNDPKSPSDYAEFVEINDDYTLKVKTVKGGYEGWFSKIGIMNEKKEYIWAFQVWYLPTGIQSHMYKSGEVMDRYIGDSYAPDYGDWHGVGAYFQWGRPFAISWGSDTYNTTTTTATDLKVSAKNPDCFLKTDGAERHNSDWWLGDWQGARTDRKDDFWGNPNTTAQEGSPEKGTKSIFDPCPKGWMVVSPAVIKEVIAGKESEFVINNNEKVRSLIYKYDGENKAYWHFSGLKWASSGGNPNNCWDDIVSCWSNSSYHSYDATDHDAYGMSYRFSVGTWELNNGRATGMSVRCMKDDDNR